MVKMDEIDWMSAFSRWQSPLKYLQDIDMIFGLSILLSVSAHFCRLFVFLYYCYLLSFSALFKIFERFTTCMLSRLVRFRFVRTFLWTLHAHKTRDCCIRNLMRWKISPSPLITIEEAFKHHSFIAFDLQTSFVAYSYLVLKICHL